MMLKKDLVNGFTFYRGPSMLNGKPIRAVATKITSDSVNEKTGPMIQVYIMPDDIKPSEALKTGQDEAVCGSCVHRPIYALDSTIPIEDRKSPCYVLVWQSVDRVWQASSYKDIMDAEEIGKQIAPSGKSVRFGAWGDPAMVPFDIMAALLRGASHHTGYTHQWNKRKFNFLKNYFMASVENSKLAAQAVKKGFRTFRIKATGMPLADNEIACPADSRGVQCIDCKLCNGSKQAKNIVIDSHGARKGGISYA